MLLCERYSLLIGLLVRLLFDVVSELFQLTLNLGFKGSLNDVEVVLVRVFLASGADFAQKGIEAAHMSHFGGDSAVISDVAPLHPLIVTC